MFWDNERPVRCCCPSFKNVGCHVPPDGRVEACGQPAEWLLPVLNWNGLLPFCFLCGQTLAGSGLADLARSGDAQHIPSIGMPPDVFGPAWFVERLLDNE